eukprot:PhM_4_TR16136/c0_g1_i1/m.33644/K10406/KIFC2_3; kinesin family member C2/C3
MSSSPPPPTSSLSSSALTYFDVHHAAEGKTFTLSVRTADAALLKIKKIRRTLAQMNSVDPARIELRWQRPDGTTATMLDHMTGAHFELNKQNSTTTRLLMSLRGNNSNLVNKENQNQLVVAGPSSSSSSETEALMNTCAAMDTKKFQLRQQLQELRASLDEHKQKKMREWDAQRVEFDEEMKRVRDRWTRNEKPLLCAKIEELTNALEERGDASALLLQDIDNDDGLREDVRQRLREQAVNITTRWETDCNLLRSIWEQDKADWETDRRKLEQESLERQEALMYGRVHSQTNGTENNISRSNNKEVLARLAHKKEAVFNIQNEVRALRDGLEASRERTEESKVIVTEATRKLEAARAWLSQRHPEALSRQLVTSIAECQMDKDKIAVLKQKLELLTTALQRESTARKQLHGLVEDLKGCVRVVLRMRPTLDFERTTAEKNKHVLVPVYMQEEGVVDAVDDTTVRVATPTLGTKYYDFYRVLGPSSTQEDAFAEVAPLIQSAIDGINVCILAYGQTGSGKTHTILGPHDGRCGRADAGILPRSVEHLFQMLTSTFGAESTWSVSCSMVELYLDDVRDLLRGGAKLQGKTTVPVKSDAVAPVDVSSAAEALQLMREGAAQRQVHPTLMNPVSSRSHTIFTLHVRVETDAANSGSVSHSRRGRSSSTTSTGGVIVRTSKLVFVDLAGSERVSRSQSSGDRLKEVQHINKSLSALGDVVASLSQASQLEDQSQSSGSATHIPYRNSKLTQLLQECLGGNARTLMVACVCPVGAVASVGDGGDGSGGGLGNNLPETISTLTFASRVKTVRNKSSRNIAIMSERILEARDQGVKPEDNN